MSVSIPLTGPTEVTRVGATDQWTGLGDGLPATCSPLQPGNKTWNVRQRLEPSLPLAFLPTELELRVDASYAPVSSGTQVVDDIVQLGDSIAPSGANYATLVAETASLNIYTISTAGINLADLNAGNVYLWLGWKAIPDVAFNGADWDIDVTYDGAAIYDGGAPTAESGTWTAPVVFGNGVNAINSVDLDLDVTVAATYIGGGSAPPYVPLNVRSHIESHEVGASGSAYVEDGLGGTDTAVPAPTDFASSDTTVKRASPLTGNLATEEFTVIGNTTAPSSVPNNPSIVAENLSATVVAPDDSTLTLAAVTLLYEDQMPATDNDFDGPFGQTGDDMGFAKLNDVRTISAQFTRPSTQEAYDATGSPAFRVYEAGTTVPILTGSLALHDDGNTVGFYSANIDVTAANGFELNKTYTVRASATVDGVAQAGIIDRFQVRGIADDVWSATREPVVAGDERAETRGAAVDQLYGEIFNYGTNDGSTKRMYADDAEDADGDVAFTMTVGRDATNLGTILKGRAEPTEV